MTVEQFAQISNYTTVAATCVLGLALLAYVAEWAFARKVEANAPAMAGSAGAASPVAEESDVEPVTDRFSRIGLVLTVLATALMIVSVVTRGLAAERVPWGNMYEFGLMGITIALVIYLVLVWKYQVQWAGGIVVAFGLVVLGMSLSTYVPAGPLVPALDSHWFIIHVGAVVLAGAFFLVGAAASVLYLIRARAEAKGTVGPVLRRFPAAAVMDKIAYRVNAMAFPLWTFGALIAGPIWAHYAWGRYWGWDPKEVWAFITWVVYAGYLHARATAGWKGRRAAYFCLIGFVTFLFSYYGVNLFGSGLHSYAK
ncbi:c-type cytochrome biogenesis protein CcsB [Aeromicrobium sp. YIM 150415]|uniref:c-type cytochrome biogenesis protein CcsB n=1 Tax=Aeromicrobium sp. YIM 150415 TaxID=2803912 RepID=UPI00196325B8|nr:c-type cytochrome biogenesis protein CcsB [Aeromicrobium sp. YIM 150415]MBM9462270.1 c-type cytochrome biogenesis protein CcsB [Aeromicrobium sp. YIM 150415]